MIKYKKIYKSKTEYEILFIDDSLNIAKYINENNKMLQEWLNAGNQFEVIPYVPPTLADYKKQAIEKVSQDSFDKRQPFLPDYKLINAGMDVYEDDEPGTKLKYKKTVKAFRVEFYRLKTAIENAVSLEGVDLVVAGENYPTNIIN